MEKGSLTPLRLIVLTWAEKVEMKFRACGILDLKTSSGGCESLVAVLLPTGISGRAEN